MEKEQPVASKLLTRVMTEYNEGQDYLRQKKLRWVQHLILFNNLAREAQSISSKEIFSFFHRILSGLYSDVLQSVFMPSEDSDYKKSEVLNKLRQSDFQEMEMWLVNYDWTWDAAFFGEGWTETLVFDKESKLMKPSVVNPLYMAYDPFFSEPKNWRYYSKWKTFSKYDLLRLKKKGVISQNFDISKIAAGLEVELWDYKNRRDAARLGNSVTNSSYSDTNDIYQILEHFTIADKDTVDHNGKPIPEGHRIIVWTDKNFGTEIRVEPLTNYIPEDEPWPIVKKQIFREPHSSLSISVPDIIEDSHRAKSVLLNLLFMAAKDDANPIYLYDPDHVQDVTAFLSRQINQHIPVDDLERAVKPMNTKPAMSAAVNSFMALLGTESAEAVGTAIIQPNMNRGKKSATEAAMLQQIADLTGSLQAKVISMGEKDFWSHWYLRLINPKNIKASDEKIIKMTTATGISFETVKMPDWKMKFPPKIQILSKKEAEYKELVLRRDLMQNYPILTKSMDKRALDNFNKYVYFPKFIEDTNLIDRIVPSSIDQIKARQENELLSQGKFVPVQPTDDDETHMYEHAMCPNTVQKWAHYFIHEVHRAAKQKKKDEEQKQNGQGEQPNEPSMFPNAGPGKNLGKNMKQNKINVQKDKQNPEGAAVPLAKDTQNSVQQKGKVLV